jgi:hypothetical protein
VAKVMMPHEVSPSPLSGFSPVAATRPSRTPCCKLANRSRFSAADLAGAEPGGIPLAGSLAGSLADLLADLLDAAAVPGTRLARGTRFGRPTDVVPAEVGA